MVKQAASGLACLSAEERDLGSVIVDMGGGTTSIAIFMEGKLVYVDTIKIGGNRVTTDIARILSTPLADAERLKAIDGSVYANRHHRRCPRFTS